MFEFSDQSRSSVGEGLPAFEIPVGAKMTVLGVGGGGGNAVSRMIDEQLPGVRFVVANTDEQALKEVVRKHGPRAAQVIQIGKNLTRGLGSGGRPEVGRRAIEESLEEVVEAVRDSDLLFIAAGMGGGTGTGAAPVIAAAARDLGILTIAIVSTPFGFEARRRMVHAEEGLADLHQAADTVIIVPNEKLMEIVPAGTSFEQALKMADSVLLGATRGISGILVRSGAINTDFADVRTIMGGGGKAILGSGTARGEDAAVVAAQEAISSPLLEGLSLRGATRLLINVRASGELDAIKVGRAVSLVQESAHVDAEVIFGMDFDSQMGSDVAVTVIATGFEPEVGYLLPTVATQPVNPVSVSPPSAPIAVPVQQSVLVPSVASPAEDSEADSPGALSRLRGFLSKKRATHPAQPSFSPLPSRPAERPSYVRGD